MSALKDFSNDVQAERKEVRAEKGVQAGIIALSAVPVPEVVAWLVGFWQGELFGIFPCVDWYLLVIFMVL